MAAYDKMTRLTVRELGLLDLNEHPFHISADPRFLYLNRTAQGRAISSREYHRMARRSVRDRGSDWRWKDNPGTAFV